MKNYLKSTMFLLAISTSLTSISTIAKADTGYDMVITTPVPVFDGSSYGPINNGVIENTTKIGRVKDVILNNSWFVNDGYEDNIAVIGDNASYYKDKVTALLQEKESYGREEIFNVIDTFLPEILREETSISGTLDKSTIFNIKSDLVASSRFLLLIDFIIVL